MHISGFIIFIIVLVLILFIIGIIGNWKVYKKAGKKGWECIVPIYGYWVLVEIAEVNWWWFFVIILGSINFKVSDPNLQFDLIIGLMLFQLIGTFVCYYNIAKKFKKDTGFAVLMTIFPFVMLPIIGFSDKYEFDNEVKVTPNGPFDSNKNKH